MNCILVLSWLLFVAFKGIDTDGLGGDRRVNRNRNQNHWYSQKNMKHNITGTASGAVGCESCHLNKTRSAEKNSMVFCNQCVFNPIYSSFTEVT